MEILPKPILYIILDYLSNAGDWFRLLATCKYLHDLPLGHLFSIKFQRETLAWLYKFELRREVDLTAVSIKDVIYCWQSQWRLEIAKYQKDYTMRGFRAFCSPAFRTDDSPAIHYDTRWTVIERKRGDKRISDPVRSLFLARDNDILELMYIDATGELAERIVVRDVKFWKKFVYGNNQWNFLASSPNLEWTSND